MNPTSDSALNMEAALFTMRCFETVEAEYPFFVTSFVVFGTWETISSTAERLFAEKLGMCGRPSRRVHKTGPLPITRFVAPDLDEEIAWLGVATRLKNEAPNRPINEGTCLFRGPATITTSECVDIDFENEEDLIECKSLRPVESKPSPSPKFLFIGSRWQTDAAERAGRVFLIEASNLGEAADACAAVIENADDECLLIEWCCPVFKAES